MKLHRCSYFKSVLVGLMLAAGYGVCAQNVAFTYQGRLDNSGSAANGNYDFSFELFDTATNGMAVDGPLTNLDVGVTNGLFVTVISNVPAGIFNGSNLWLEIGVRTNGGAGAFTTLSPRQNLTPAPYAVTAANLSSPIGFSQLPATLLTNNATNAVLSGGFTGNGGGLTNLQAGGIVPSLGTMAYQSTNSPSMQTATNYGPLTIGANATFPYAAPQVAISIPSYGLIQLGANTSDVIYSNPNHQPGSEIGFGASSRIALVPGLDQLNSGAIQLGNTVHYGSQGADCPVIITQDKWPFSTTDPLGYSSLLYFNTGYYNGATGVGNYAPGIRAETVDTNGGVSLVFYQVSNFNPLVGQSPGTKIGTEFWSNGNVVHGRVTSDLVQVSPVNTYGVSWDAPTKTEVDLSGDIVITNVPLTYARTNQEDTQTLYFFSGLASPGITFPINWYWGSEPMGNPGPPTNVPAGTVLKVEVELLTDSAITYLARATSYSYPPLTADSNAESFFVAVGGGLSTAESNAVNRLVLNLKANNLWNQWDCIYPMVGGTSNSCSWNLVNPGLYQIGWTVGNSTFSPGGWTSDGNASFGDTQFNPATAAAPNYTQNSGTLLAYSGTPAPTYVFWNSFIDALDSFHRRAGVVMLGSNSLAGDGLNDSFAPGFGSVQAMTNFSGMVAGMRTTSPLPDTVYGDGQFNSDLWLSTGVPNASFYIAARNNVGHADDFIGAQFRLVMIGGGLTDSQISAMAKIVQQFELTLGRP
jgi:hypothetical protein